MTDLHVLPLEGHTASRTCWCRPWRDHIEPRLWIHRQAGRA